jgi:hypothetical protein
MVGYCGRMLERFFIVTMGIFSSYQAEDRLIVGEDTSDT